MNSQFREQAIKLRVEKNFSYSEIKQKLGVPKSTLSYWLRGFPLSEERILELLRQGWKKGEASRERFRLTMQKKRELKDREIYNKYQKRFAKLSKDAFFVAGLMLYLGEGDKRRYERISLANTNPEVIKFFIKWMIEFLKIKKEEIKAELHFHEGMDVEKEKKFWRNELKFSETQFYKTQIRKLRKGSYSYKESSNHGTCSIYVMGVERKRELMMAIHAFIDRYLKNI